jgi:hypothetical protein
MLLLIIVLVLLLGGGGWYYGNQNWGPQGGIGIVGVILVCLLIWYLLGGHGISLR